MSDEELALVPVLVNGEVVYVNRSGDLWRWTQYSRDNPKFTKIDTVLNNNGYKRPKIGGKCVLQHRIIASAFLGLNMSDTKIQTDHKNGMRHDNRLTNLRLVTHQQNQHNRTRALGYHLDKNTGKWQAKIQLNNKRIYLGCFVNESDARKSYLDAKLKYHQI